MNATVEDDADAAGLPPDVEMLVSDLQATIGVMRHLTCSPLQVTGDQWSVVVGRAGGIADSLYGIWEREWQGHVAEHEANKTALARAERASAPGSEGDRKTADAIWAFLRSAASTIVRQTDARLATAVEPSHDAELIRLCDRLVEIDAAERTLQDTIKNDEELETAEEPLHAEWHTISTRLYDIGRPVTIEGATAMARAANANTDHDRQRNVTAPDLADWLALAACAFLAGTPAPIPSD